MLICAAGDTHGAINLLYEDILAFESSLGARFDWVLHVGDFGIWPNPERIDRATRKHGGAGDFPAWLAEGREAPRPTLFIKGNHEEFAWIERCPDNLILPNLHYLPNGETRRLGVGDASLVVGGLGGCSSESTYLRGASPLKWPDKRHFTHDEMEKLSQHGRLDVLLLHDAPAGIPFPQGSNGRKYVSDSSALVEAVGRAQPLVCFFGHHHTRVDAEIEGVRCIGLNKVHSPGNLVAIEVNAPQRQWAVLGEWP